MTNITELAQLRDRTVDYPYYLVECDCGKIYPSSELSGGEPMGDSGDYSDCYCPHCGEGEEHFAECADPETAWKAQQDKIDALVEALEKAQQRNAELEAQNDYFAYLVAMARVSADKAIRKFPQPNYVLLKVAEEAGEVVQAGVHYAENRMEWGQVEGEIVQLLAMLIRLVTEGDQINGITPPALCSAVIKVEAD
ncbi:hypothetical protein [Klebsiella quasipneumoniae]|uniref:hypothetical protein n=1 Tax=Klebsiella quasipneumoniae TaxID=1463165 RepID=UPI00237DD047|nr:hypothetical protein [Klebsiella quasipneumoniae]MDL2152613.1 hypothetical protein [Klebsiella quasipneumoniae]MDW2824656.1 hypothetical protein [Klebsiella quasipneumoniae]